MSKKIVFIHGGPRKNGNTRSAAALAIESAREKGAEVTEIDAVSLEFKAPGCIACLKCQQSEEFKCALNDEVAEKVSTLPDYDVIILDAPIYWWGFPAQLKIFIDRVFSLVKISGQEHKSPLSGKVLGLLATGGGGVEDNLDVLEAQWKHPAEMLECSFVSSLFPNVLPDEGSIVKDPVLVEKAKAFGRSIA